MTTNANAAQLVEMGMAKVTKADKDAICRAFRRAVARFCNTKPGNRMQFNEYMMDELRNVDPTGALIGRMAFEVPAAIGGAATGFIETLAAAGGPTGTAAAKVVALMTKLGGAAITSRGWRLVLSGAISRALGGRAIFPDATLDGRPVEFKGPGDSENPPKSQFKDYQSLDPNGDLILADCEICEASCAPDNKCPPTSKYPG